MAIAYTNRTGSTYYLHARKTKTGKPRYVFARELGDGALDELPAGFEIVESMNGQVSLAKKRARLITEAEEGAVRAELERRRRGSYRLEVKADALTIYQPLRSAETFERLAVFVSRARVEEFIAGGQYDPVLRFVLDDAEARTFRAERMTYRGEGGWSRPLAFGEIRKLAAKFVPHLGEDSFFDLY